MFVLPILYIVSSFILISGATVIYNGNRRSIKYKTFALIFVAMAVWQQSALLISLLPPEQANVVFIYGLIPTILVTFLLLLHGVYLITNVYSRKYAFYYKLLFIPPVINILLLPVDGWLYQGEVLVYSEHSLPGPGGFLNFGIMFFYLVIMIALLMPKILQKNRPSQIWMTGLVSFVLWSLVIVVSGEMTGDWDSFSLVPLGINFWAFAVYISVHQYDSLPSYERRYNLLFERAPIGIMITDSKGTIHEVSPRVSDFLELPLDDLLGQKIYKWLENEEQEKMLSVYFDNFEKRKAFQNEEHSFYNEKRQIKWLAISSEFTEMEGDPYQLLMIHDITGTKQREKQIHDLAYYDHLTNLYNRVSFNHTFENWLKNKSTFALLILDLNSFKSINDKYGHYTGDQVLMYFAEQLNTSVGPSDFVARLSGDEFVIMLNDDKQTEYVINKIRSNLKEPFELADNQSLLISSSIGVAIYPRDGEVLDDLFKEADDRMYEDKRDGKSIHD
ncbi:diguanylate cyclase domain-containing protein [Gracilibacillus kekensis]|uniref:PAS domain S-box-containing protein/diguanylate cyclase (GGDEF) domain-containing protein n=1 Tax=Gracilibacillus kekensis TaxID=1027249 RepID=A0A1M7Q7W3_9BACI|nr:diguanylate cyclase [Gracilibacillus kekensis]SHN26406.1 PAS domain S-box-containing protein/diguanylate cyclase (GGDEF) domain-containing protein [Gracilibacillus kekensis]